MVDTSIIVMNFNVLKEVNSRGGRYWHVCYLLCMHTKINTHLTTGICTNLFQIRAAAVQFAVSYPPYSILASLLQATKSWAGPGNEANSIPHTIFTFSLFSVVYNFQFLHWGFSC